jgi:seryl-tRNA synthetase
MKAIRPKLDFAKIIANLDTFGTSLINRGDLQGKDKLLELLKLNEVRKTLKKDIEDVQSKRNKGQTVDKQLLSNKKQQLESVEADFFPRCTALPNWIHPEVPIGEEANAKIVKESAYKIEAKKLNHLEICEKFDLADFVSATRTTGTKFVYLKREAALLEMALQRFTVDQMIKKYNFVPISTPDLIKPWIIEACGFQPRGSESQVYHITDHDLCLIGTSEIAIAGYLAGSKLKGEERLLGISHCFRTEAGATGKESKGLYRLHQFAKVEMFVTCDGNDSERIHDTLVTASTEICDRLGLMWRVLEMPTKELGASAYRKYDVEVFMPGSQRWGEVASITNTIDYQSRRLDIKINGNYAHTLNGTACAVPRLLLSLLETHQQSDASVRIPKELIPIAGFENINRKAT